MFSIRLVIVTILLLIQHSTTTTSSSSQSSRHQQRQEHYHHHHSLITIRSTTGSSSLRLLDSPLTHEYYQTSTSNHLTCPAPSPPSLAKTAISPKHDQHHIKPSTGNDSNSLSVVLPNLLLSSFSEWKANTKKYKTIKWKINNTSSNTSTYQQQHQEQHPVLQHPSLSTLTSSFDDRSDTNLIHGKLTNNTNSSSSLPSAYNTTVKALAEEPKIYHPDPYTGSGSELDPLKALSGRTNYASFDCSASIHRSSKSSKSASAILNEKKDRYMLTPCRSSEPTNNADGQQPNFVVFELCDEIEIDNVVIANFEFFSSMFKLIRISVSSSGLEGTAGVEWTQVGLFRARNVRGLQVFPIKHLKGFYRYVRLDFLSHYGSEYYCPLSLVRIYGLTQIDAYRRDQHLESTTLAPTEEEIIESELELPPDLVLQASVQYPPAVPQPRTENLTGSATVEEPTVNFSSPEAPSSSVSQEDSYTSPTRSEHDGNDLSQLAEPQASPVADSFLASEITNLPLPSTQTEHIPTPLPLDNISPSESITIQPNDRPNDPQYPEQELTHTTVEQPSNPGRTADSIAATSPKHQSTDPPRVVKPNSEKPGSESIFGQIMKRLNHLETDQELGLKYVEEQTMILGKSLAKLDVRLGILESNLNDQNERYHQSLRDLNDLKMKLLVERSVLNHQIDSLNSTITFIKRFGMVQFLSILTILVFLGLTRLQHTTTTAPTTTKMTSASTSRYLSQIHTKSQSVDKTSSKSHLAASKEYLLTRKLKSARSPISPLASRSGSLLALNRLNDNPRICQSNPGHRAISVNSGGKPISCRRNSSSNKVLRRDGSPSLIGLGKLKINSSHIRSNSGHHQGNSAKKSRFEDRAHGFIKAHSKIMSLESTTSTPIDWSTTEYSSTTVTSDEESTKNDRNNSLTIDDQDLENHDQGNGQENLSAVQNNLTVNHQSCHQQQPQNELQHQQLQEKKGAIKEKESLPPSYRSSLIQQN